MSLYNYFHLEQHRDFRLTSTQRRIRHNHVRDIKAQLYNHNMMTGFVTNSVIKLQY